MLEKSQTYFFFGLLLTIGVLFLAIVLPFLAPLILAAAFAVVFRPLYDYLTRAFGDSPRIAAWVTILLIVILVLTPLTFAAFQVAREARDLYLTLAENASNGLSPGNFLRDAIARVSPSFAENTDQYLKQATSWVLSHVGGFFTGTLAFGLNIFLWFLALYYFLVEGTRIRNGVVLFSPLPDKYDEVIIGRLSRTINAVVRGNLVIAMIQGIIAGIGFTMFGVPNPALWGTVAAISALIPGVGTSLVLGPAVIYLFLTDQNTAALGLLAWAVLAVGLIDNFLGPKLVGRGGGIHPFAVLLSVLGGITLFGPLGFIMGPLIASLFFTLLDIYASLRNSRALALEEDKTRRRSNG